MFTNIGWFFIAPYLAGVAAPAAHKLYYSNFALYDYLGYVPHDIFIIAMTASKMGYNTALGVQDNERSKYP